MNDISTKVRNDTHSLLVFKRMSNIGKSRLMMIQRYVVAADVVRSEANNMLNNNALSSSFRDHFNNLVSGIDRFSIDMTKILSSNRDKIRSCSVDNAEYYLINPDDVDKARELLMQYIRQFFRDVIENIAFVDVGYSKPKIMSFYYCYVSYLVMMVESLGFVAIISRIYNNIVIKDIATKGLICQEVQSYVLMCDSMRGSIKTCTEYERDLKYLF